MPKENFISIIIPTLNAERYLKGCLESLAQLNYPKDLMEIMVVDGGSHDDTLNIASESKVRVLKKQNLTISALRNSAAFLAQGEILAFIDADCIAPVNWLNTVLEVLNGHSQIKNIGAVGAEYSLPDKPSWIERVWDLHIDKHRKNGEVSWIPSGCLIISKERFLDIRGFRENLITSEDVDLCKRLRDKGSKIIADHRLSCIHIGNPKNIVNFFLKEFWRGKGALQNFLFALPKIKLTRAMAFALFMLLCIFGSIAGLINGLFNRQWLVFGFSISSGIFSALVLAIKTIYKTKNWQYLLPLTLVYLVYGIARAFCILDYSNWINSKTSHLRKKATAFLEHE